MPPKLRGDAGKVHDIDAECQVGFGERLLQCGERCEGQRHGRSDGDVEVGIAVVPGAEAGTERQTLSFGTSRVRIARTSVNSASVTESGGMLSFGKA
jgi:hypothetical protein